MAALTAGGVLAAVRARHPSYHETRVPAPVLLQALGAAAADLAQSGARVNPGALAVETYFAPVPFPDTGGAALPDHLALLGGTVRFAPGALRGPSALRILPYAQRLGLTQAFSVYQLGGVLLALGEPADWPDALGIVVAYVPLPVAPTRLDDVILLPGDARQALVARVAVTAAVFAAAQPSAGVAEPDVARAATEAGAAEDAWLAGLAARRALAPFVMREG